MYSTSEHLYIFKISKYEGNKTQNTIQQYSIFREFNYFTLNKWANYSDGKLIRNTGIELQFVKVYLTLNTEFSTKQYKKTLYALVHQAFPRMG